MIQDRCFGAIPLKKLDNGWNLLLLLHKKGLYWGFPKGHILEGENDSQAAIRELKEETNLDVERLLLEEPFSETYEFLRHGEKVLKKVSYFPLTIKGEIKLQEDEIEDFMWVPMDEAMRKITFQTSKDVCERFLEAVSFGLIKL